MHGHPHAETETALRYALEPVLAWLNDGGDPWAMDIAYWRHRDVDQINRMHWDVQSILDGFDATLHLFWPDDDPDRPPEPYSLTEAQMRSEILGHLADLQKLGYLNGWTPPRDIARR